MQELLDAIVDFDDAGTFAAFVDLAELAALAEKAAFAEAFVDDGFEVQTGDDDADVFDGDQAADFAQDALFGEGGDDTLRADAGDDVVDGGVGNDFLLGGIGDDVLLGGDGDDRAFGANDDDLLFGGAGDDALVGGPGRDLLFGGDGDDELRSGGNGANVLTGGDGADTLISGGSDDLLLGGAGADEISGGSGTDVVIGGAGDDVLAGGAGTDLLIGGDGADTFFYTTGGEILPVTTGAFPSPTFRTASSEIDVILDFDPAADTLDISKTAITSFEAFLAHASDAEGGMILSFGENEFIQFVGLTVADFDGANILFGTSETFPNVSLPLTGLVIDPNPDLFARTLLGSAEGERIDGDERDERILAGDGDDFALGGDGDDLIEGGDGDDVLTAGRAGLSDILIVDENGEPLAPDPDVPPTEGAAGLASIVRGNGVDTLLGQGGDDVLQGDEGDDSLAGGAGADRLDGDQGDDRLNGGAGDDILFGEEGLDRLFGGEGEDIFVYSRGGFEPNGIDLSLTGSSEVDLIQDFNVTEDRLDFSETEMTSFDQFLAAARNTDYGMQIFFGGRDVLKIRNVSVEDIGQEDIIFRPTSDQIPGPVSGRIVDSRSITFGEGEADVLRAGIFGDQLLGRGGDDALLGGSAADVLSGGDGDDRLLGKDGDDQLEGGSGLDILTGGGGADRFIYANSDSNPYGVDVVKDFDLTEDVIGLRGFDFADFNALLAVARDTTFGMQFNFGEGDFLKLVGVSVADLEAHHVDLLP